jgi:hypothetical protein
MRTADPVAAMFVQPLTIWVRLLGILGGLVILMLGLAIVGRLGGPQ